MFHQNMTIKLWLVIWLTFIGLYFVLPQTELLEQENFVLPLIENNPDEGQSPEASEPLTEESESLQPASVISKPVLSQPAGEQSSDEITQDTIASGPIPNANLPYIPDLEIGVTEREQVLNTLGQPARQLQQGKVLEYYFEQHSESLQVLTEEESNLIMQNELDSEHSMYHLMIEFDYNNIIMAMNMQPL